MIFAALKKIGLRHESTIPLLSGTNPLQKNFDCRATSVVSEPEETEDDLFYNEPAHQQNTGRNDTQNSFGLKPPVIGLGISFDRPCTRDGHTITMQSIPREARFCGEPQVESVFIPELVVGQARVSLEPGTASNSNTGILDLSEKEFGMFFKLKIVHDFNNEVSARQADHAYYKKVKRTLQWKYCWVIYPFNSWKRRLIEDKHSLAAVRAGEAFEISARRLQEALISLEDLQKDADQLRRAQSLSAWYERFLRGEPTGPEEFVEHCEKVG